ncbi:MAG: patatin family protein [Collinsella sp.]|nr:patatin family protein [Collinsella sp.]
MGQGLGSVASQGDAARADAFDKDPLDLGVVLEGGGFRGLFTAGVLDVWMEHGILAADTVGVSAGAAFGCNYKSGQIGRAIRYNKRFCADPRYAGLRSLITTGDLYNRDFAYHEVPFRLDPFDTAAFSASPMAFTVVCTDVDTGDAVYRPLENGDERDIEWMRASASIPVVSRPVRIGGGRYLDGGVADPIPIDWMLRRGHARNVAILTQPAGFRKEPVRALGAIRRALRPYPRLVELIETRHERYNAILDRVARLERSGGLFVIRPSESVKVPAVVRDPEVLEHVYQVGRRDGAEALARLGRYLQDGAPSGVPGAAAALR